MCPVINSETANPVLGPDLDNCDETLENLPPTIDTYTENGALACDGHDTVLFTLVD